MLKYSNKYSMLCVTGELKEREIAKIAQLITEEHFSVIFSHFKIDSSRIEISMIQRYGDRAITTFTKFLDLWYSTIYDHNTLKRFQLVLETGIKNRNLPPNVKQAWETILGKICQ